MIEGLFMGASMAFCRGLKYITKDMQMVHPTFLLAVPLIYEKFYSTIQKTLKKQGQDKLVNTLFAANNVTSKFGLNIAKPIATKIMAQFGGNIDMFIAGGARVDPKVLAFFRSMGIPVRQLECCSGDLANLKVKSCDIEAWSPRQQKYFEVCSCSNLGDAQARRLKIRTKGENGTYLVHTLNNTVVAPPRMLIALLENHYQADGSVIVPEVLRPYMGGKERLVPKK